MKKLFATIALLFAQATIAPAATMTFDNYDFATSNLTAKTYVEAGITAKGNAPLFESFGRGFGNSLYIADGGWGGPNFIGFTMASVFNAVSFDLTPSLFNYFVTNTKSGAENRGTFVNVRVEGFGADGLKAVTSFNMGALLQSKTYLLGTAFTNLTGLVIGFEPTAGFNVPVQVGPNRVGRCTDAPCSRYRIDNVTLAPVPLPATLGLMLSTLFGLSILARRRRTSSIG